MSMSYRQGVYFPRKCFPTSGLTRLETLGFRRLSVFSTRLRAVLALCTAAIDVSRCVLSPREMHPADTQCPLHNAYENNPTHRRAFRVSARFHPLLSPLFSLKGCRKQPHDEYIAGARRSTRERLGCRRHCLRLHGPLGLLDLRSIGFDGFTAGGALP